MKPITAIASLFACMAAASSVAAEFGAWHTVTQGTISQAVTGNQSDSTFGYLCFEQNTCGFFLDTGNECEEDGKYPLLINIASGAMYVTTSCWVLDTKAGRRHLLIIDDDNDALADGMHDDGQIGFAIPLASGKFAVSRFSLNGASAAIKRTRVDQARIGRQGKDSTSSAKLKDESL